MHLNTPRAPTGKLVLQGLVRAVAAWHIRLLQAMTNDRDDPTDHTAVVNRGAASARTPLYGASRRAKAEAAWASGICDPLKITPGQTT